MQVFDDLMIKIFEILVNVEHESLIGDIFILLCDIFCDSRKKMNEAYQPRIEFWLQYCLQTHHSVGNKFCQLWRVLLRQVRSHWDWTFDNVPINNHSNNTNTNGNNNGNVVNYNNKLDSLINLTEQLSFIIIKKDYSTLCEQILVNFEKILEIENQKTLLNGTQNSNNNNDNDTKNNPFLYNLYKSQWNDGIQLFISSLRHFDRCYNYNQKFITKYMNHPKLKNINLDSTVGDELSA